MNITQAGAEVVTALEGAGIRVQSWENKQVVGPVAILVPAEPFLDTDGETTFDEPFVVHYVVQLIAARGTGEVVRSNLETMIGGAVLALRNINMTVDEVQYPLIGTEDEKLTIGAQVVVSAAINLKEDV